MGVCCCPFGASALKPANMKGKLNHDPPELEESRPSASTGEPPPGSWCAARPRNEPNAVMSAWFPPP
eukprot:scaffold173038_cov30-Tisochrysis_lutea.AAC.3